MVKLIKTLMSLRGLNQVELSEKSKVSRTSLVRYLNGSSELSSAGLLKVLDTLGADVETLVKKEVAKALGADEGTTKGEDLVFLLEHADPITRKTILETLISSLRTSPSLEVKTKLSRLSNLRDSIKTVGKGS